MPSPKPDDLLTTSQVAEKLGVAPGTVRRYINDRLLPEPGWVHHGRRRQRGYSLRWVEEAEKTLRGDAAN